MILRSVGEAINSLLNKSKATKKKKREIKVTKTEQRWMTFSKWSSFMVEVN